MVYALYRTKYHICSTKLIFQLVSLSIMTLLYGINKVADRAKTQTGLQAAYSLIAKGVFLGLLRFTSRLAFL